MGNGIGLSKKPSVVIWKRTVYEPKQSVSIGDAVFPLMELPLKPEKTNDRLNIGVFVYFSPNEIYYVKSTHEIFLNASNVKKIKFKLKCFDNHLYIGEDTIRIDGKIIIQERSLLQIKPIDEFVVPPDEVTKEYTLKPYKNYTIQVALQNPDDYYFTPDKQQMLKLMVFIYDWEVS